MSNEHGFILGNSLNEKTHHNQSTYQFGRYYDLVEFFYSVRLVIIKNHRKDNVNWHENSYYLLVVCNVRYVLLLRSLSRNLLKDLFQEYYECPVQDSRFFYL